MSHPTRLIVLERLPDLVAGVHHERPLADHGLADWFAGKHEKPRCSVGLQADLSAIAIEGGKLDGLERRRVELHRPGLDDDQRGVTFRDLQLRCSRLGELDIPDVDGSEGLESVEIDQQLSEAAQYFADYMAETNTFGHTADGSRPAERAREHGYDYCLVSENIGHQYSSRGFTADELAKKFFEVWKQSAEHRKNMLNRHVTETGVAVAQSEDTGYYFAVQMFGRPRSDSIEFEVANQSGTTIEYEIGGRTFPLPPGYTRTHQGCVPEKLVFQWPGEAEPQSETVEPNDGDRFTVERDPSDGFKVERE